MRCFLQNDLLTLPPNDKPNTASNLFLQIKFHWNTIMRIHLYMVLLLHCNRDLGPPEPKIFTIWIFTEIICQPLTWTHRQHSRYTCFLQNNYKE